MANTIVKADARNRFARTLWQGFGVDALLLIGGGLLTLLEEGDVLSGVFWTAVCILILKSFLTALVSYLVRLKVAPRVDTAPPSPGVGGQYAG